MKRSSSEADLSPREEEDEEDDPFQSWIDYSKSNSNTKEATLQSPLAKAKNVLQFTLECVFMWNCPNIDWHDIDDRLQMMEFVTDWLGSDTEEDRNKRIPSLFKLCAQRIAMELFHKFVADIDINFEEARLLYFTDTLQNEILSELKKMDVSAFLHEYIVEEVYIFTIVYLLYIDIRKLEYEPEDREELTIPIRRSSYDDCWWPNKGRNLVTDAVRNHGRGSFAKAGLLPYSAFLNMKRFGNIWPIDVLWHMTYFDCELGSLRINHPFAASVAVVPIIAALFAFYIHADESYEASHDDVENHLVPWCKAVYPETTQKDMAELYSSMVKVSHFKALSQNIYNLQPLKMNMAKNRKFFQDIIDIIQVIKEFGIPCKYEGFCGTVRSVRFNGNYTKFELLRNAMIIGGIERSVNVLDLEDCINLDKECLEAICKWLRPKTVYLKGTPFNIHSPILNKIKKSEGGEKETQRKNGKRKPKDHSSISFSFEPRVTKEKLEKANKRLQDENISLKKQVDDLKDRIIFGSNQIVQEKTRTNNGREESRQVPQRQCLIM
ncbi:predicted protein [Chaetoceros tenuissimus]|uniref:Uncharacterized protein n=1 Tax=Chaetoceros tenuissimus TaxID=426638 RepID=A0AAD3H1H0_9STRA|nr:predicted protein [Chaetoceros tenuissimus]